MTPPPGLPADGEAERVREVYGRRAERGLDGRYEYWQPANLFIYQSRERALLKLLGGRLPLTGQRVLDAGCGDGSLLRDLARYGADEEQLAGIDLLPERVARARQALPRARMLEGDARSLPFDDDSFDLVLAFTLLSSVLDDGVRRSICAEVLRVVRPHGLIVVYDFWTNPLNRDARPLRRDDLRALFAGRRIDFEATTLAPPLTRFFMRLPGGRLVATALEMIPFLTTHYLAGIHPSPLPPPGGRGSKDNLG